MNALRTADTRLQRADARYATRADANQAHFPLPRPDTSLDAVPGFQGRPRLFVRQSLERARPGVSQEIVEHHCTTPAPSTAAGGSTRAGSSSREAVTVLCYRTCVRSASRV